MSRQFYPYTPAISSGQVVSAIADNPNTTALIIYLLDRLIAFHRCFIDLTGSITAVLLLSQAFDWQHSCEDLAGWCCKARHGEYTTAISEALT